MCFFFLEHADLRIIAIIEEERGVRRKRRSAYHCNLSSRTCRRKRLAIVWRPTKTSAYGSSSLTITRGVRRKRFAFSLSDSSAIVCDDTR